MASNSTEPTPSGSAQPVQGPHALSLKVMRISAPTLATSDRPYQEDYPHALPSPAALKLAQDVPSEVQEELSRYQSPTSGSAGLLGAFTSSLKQSQAGDMLSDGTSSTLADWPVSSMLVLPNSFGTIFLGETFRAYLSVRNESSESVAMPSLRVEMQTGEGASRALLLETPPRDHLAPGDKLEATVAHEIQELGAHVLVCSVSYAERSFRKFYKFDVPASPISVRTKTHAAKSSLAAMHPDHRVREKVLFEVQVQNVGPAPLVFEALELRPVKGWRWESVDRPEGAKGIWEGREVMVPEDIRQYLFALWPEAEAPARPLPPLPAAVQTPNATPDRRMANRIPPSSGPVATVNDPIGSLDIRWRMSMGEPGKLQTSQLARKRTVVPPTRCLDAGPLLEAELNLTAVSLVALKAASEGEELDLSFELWLRDLSSLAQEDDDDDDRPLSEIASPRNPVKQLPGRTFSLGVQHLAIRQGGVEEPPRQSIDSIRSETSSLFRALTSNKPNVPPTPPPKSPPPPTHTVPPPFFDTPPPVAPDADVLLLGTTLRTLDPTTETARFELTFLPTEPGFKRIGGIRLLVFGWSNEAEENVVLKQPITIREWPVIAETWVA